jgi:Tol biopolymer transport system component
MRRRAATVLLAALASLAVAASAPAKKIVTHSPDSLAPKNAPAHWLPPEAWVYNHWLPYDEGRLYRVLGITRSELWQQLRDDRRTLAQLAARHGYRSPAKLAAKLVAPRASTVGDETLRELRDRAERTITQGHLAQHVFFHSLHQFAIPSAAPDIFGVTDARFRELRRTELSPLAIGRLHGRLPGEVQAMSISVLLDRIDAGIGNGSMSAGQGEILLRRQLSQLPRWLDQQRYNGPPLTSSGALLQIPADYASNPAISADGRYVAYEAYRQKLKLAIKLGEIAVLRTNLDSGLTELISRVAPKGPNGFQPASAYNPSISGDGARVTYETSAGNQNFAKRYGQIGVMLCDLHGATKTTGIAEQAGGPALSDSKSGYNPVISGDGASVAFQQLRDGHTSIVVKGVSGDLRVAASGTRVGGERFGDVYEPGLSADGTRVVMTRTGGRVDRPASATSEVVVRDLVSGRTLLASRADGVDGLPADGPSADGAISPDGRFVAFTSQAPSLGAARGSLGLFLRDLQAGTTIRVPTPSGVPLDPVVAAGGVAVAYTVERGGVSLVRVWNARTGVMQVASRASGATGALAGGRSGDASISADGTRVAFASTAKNLAPGAGPRSIFVRDLTALTTRLVSDPAKAYGGVRP